MRSERILGNEFAAEVTRPDSVSNAFATSGALDGPAESVVGDYQQWPGIVGLLQPHAKALALGVFAVLRD